jgi:endoglucanase
MINFFSKLITFCIISLSVFQGAFASKVASVKVLDKNYLIVHFMDGEVIRRDDGKGNCAFMGHCHSADGSSAVYYRDPLNTGIAENTSSWVLKSSDDRNYRRAGRNPLRVYRKSKLNGMSISYWDPEIKPNGDYVYDHTMEHFIYLELPQPLEQGKTYTLEISNRINADKKKISFTWDVFSSRSEAIHVNIVGYSNAIELKAADLFHWMGDGGSRDYSSFEGNKVILYNLDTNEKTDAGEVSFWQKSAPEAEGYNFSNTDVWNIDFSGRYPFGNYRLVVEGIGCSDDFRIASDIYFEPYRISTQGFFYMRLGQDSPDMNPRPRIPLFIPGVDNTTVHITTLHPYHPAWGDIRIRKTDPWDHPVEFEHYMTGQQNMNAWGGRSDAYDWDKRLPHVSTVYDMLLPYILTGGVLDDDNLGIAESGNGIPDILDETRYEVDAWLRLRDGKAYAHGISCPYSEENRVRYQGGATAVAAWANALNSAMLAEAFRISGFEQLMQVYMDSALVAFNFADNLDDKMLDLSEGDGTGRIRGRDFRMMAAAYLYNLTGDRHYEDIMHEECVLNSGESKFLDSNKYNQVWGVAAYLTSDREINYPELYTKMKNTIIDEATQMEAGFIKQRPTRRATCNDAGYFWTIQNVQRTIIAHAVADDPDQREFFHRALVLEADWSLGRNPTNMIQMTTASTNLESKRSVQFAYTSGYNDGTPGLHPGHTPYWNMNDWAPNMIMGRPSWLASHGYPEQEKWPTAELFFNTDYVWSHTEFTPQQTMRGKMALYGYLLGLNRLGK